MYVRRRPTLPHRHQCSTIGAEGLSFRVRNGTGRFPFAMTAVTLGRYFPWVTTNACWRVVSITVLCCVCLFPTVSRELHSGRVAMLLKAIVYQVVGLLVPVSSTPCGASTSGLSTQWSSWEPLTPKGAWKPHLEACFPLRCFQRLSLPNVANQRCPWQDN